MAGAFTWDNLNVELSIDTLDTLCGLVPTYGSTLLFEFDPHFDFLTFGKGVYVLPGGYGSSLVCS